MKKTYGGLICGLLLFGAISAWAQSKALPLAFVDLKYDLIRQGFDRDFVTQVFQDSRVEFLPKVVSRIAYLKKERRATYQQFLKPEVVQRGRQYLREYHRPLRKAEADLGVAKEVIVAILTVETGLGKITGRYPVFNVFASLAIMDTREVIQDLNLDRRLLQRLKRKAAWGRSELKALLVHCRENQIDPFSLKGSWAGAFGYCQFLPSSLLRCGQDGNDDGQIDVFCHDDAIFCIAQYLKRAGFKNHRRGTWSKAIYRYNHSDAYVDTVLTLANWY